MPKLCIINECKKVAIYGITNNIHCTLHRLNDEINKSVKKCKTKNCDKMPNYGFEKGIGLFCKKHKTDNMIDVKSKKCIEENCNKISNYNLPSKKNALYCVNHKKENMIDVKNKKCIEENCNIQPTYNYINKKAEYCKDHKKYNMVDVKSKRCLENNCNNYPRFNYIDKKSGLYCKEHKKDDMIVIINKRCIECNLSANYNVLGEKAIYCNTHKKDNMINVTSKRCKEKNCDTRPHYNLQNKKSGIYCSKHKKDDMINVLSKRCLEENCNIYPVFNLQNEKNGIYCKEHSKIDMINVQDKNCLYESCNKIPFFNLPNKKVGLYCSKHKEENMINVKDKMCLECKITYSNKKYKGYCIRCFIYKFPDEKVSRNYKVKENHMTDFIKEQFKNEIMTFDKQTGGCSRRRPDCYIDKFTHVIIVECDENQHKETSCENKRTMELFQDFGNRPIVFIRFNPDSYINENSKKIPSSFKYHKTLDVPMIREQKEWESRLNILKETIEHWLTNIPNKEITYEYLFYDN